VFCLVQNVRTAQGPPSLSGYRCSYRGVMQPGDDIDHSPLSSAKAANEWGYTRISASPVCLNGLQRDNFILIFLSISEYPRFRLPSSLCTPLYILWIRSFLRTPCYVLCHVLGDTFFAS
jgi:hypothetical protein